MKISELAELMSKSVEEVEAMLRDRDSIDLNLREPGKRRISDSCNIEICQ